MCNKYKYTGLIFTITLKNGLILQMTSELATRLNEVNKRRTIGNNAEMRIGVRYEINDFELVSTDYGGLVIRSSFFKINYRLC